jgi:group I intron endonuclease
MKSGIYKITNTINGRVYIGRAKYIQARWKRHQRELAQNIHHNQQLQADWTQQGPSAFSFEIIELCDDNPEVLNDKEAFWMRAYEAYTKGYNRLTDKNDFTGLKHSQETKEKMRQKRHEWYKNHPEHKEKISKLRKEEWASGYRTPIQNQNRKVKQTTKDKLSKVFKEKYKSGELQPNLEVLRKARASRRENALANPDKYKKFTEVIRNIIKREYLELIQTMRVGKAQDILAEKYESNARSIRAIVYDK